MDKVSSEAEVADRIDWIDTCAARMHKLIKDQGLSKEILVPTAHLKQYVQLIDRLRMLERHLSNMVLTNNGSEASSVK